MILFTCEHVVETSLSGKQVFCCPHFEPSTQHNMISIQFLLTDASHLKSGEVKLSIYITHLSAIDFKQPLQQ